VAPMLRVTALRTRMFRACSRANALRERRSAIADLRWPALMRSMNFFSAAIRSSMSRVSLMRLNLPPLSTNDNVESIGFFSQHESA
jgi:hypothetical protein